MSLPFKTKAEERAKLFLAIKDGKDAGEPAPKRACIVYEKQLSKMPAGDLDTVKEPNTNGMFQQNANKSSSGTDLTNRLWPLSPSYRTCFLNHAGALGLLCYLQVRG